MSSSCASVGAVAVRSCAGRGGPGYGKGTPPTRAEFTEEATRGLPTTGEESARKAAPGRSTGSTHGGSMSQQHGGEDLPEPRRQEVFRLLVVAQDLQMSVAESREMVCGRFGLTEGQVRGIEREGFTARWPPL